MSTHYEYADLRRPEVSPSPVWDVGITERAPAPRPAPPRRDHRLLWILASAFLVAGLTAAAILLVWTRAPEEKKDETPETKRTQLKENLFLEVQGTQRRVIVVANVVLREGQLEGLLCR